MQEQNLYSTDKAFKKHLWNICLCALLKIWKLFLLSRNFSLTGENLSFGEEFEHNNTGAGPNSSGA